MDYLNQQYSQYNTIMSEQENKLQKWYKVSEISEQKLLFGLESKAIREEIKSGRLEAVRYKNRDNVSEESILKFIEEFGTRSDSK
jgi:hypothetical protein